MRPAPSKDARLGDGGLSAWLEWLQLGDYTEATQAWVEKMGAEFVEELEENWTDLSEAIDLPATVRSGAEAVFTAHRQEASISSALFDPGGCCGRYRVLELLGHGATACVYRCQRPDGAFCAMKVIRLDLLRQRPDFALRLERLRCEGKLLGSLKHRNIVLLHEVFETKTAIVMVMELLAGGDLREYVNQRRLHEGKARCIFQQLVMALQHIHSRGIVHRDLKLDNIVVSAGEERPVVKLIDFGSAELCESSTLTWAGTPEFNAPEIFGAPCGHRYDMRSLDLWSLGVTLYALLESRYPFKGGSIDELGARVRRGGVKFSRNTVSYEARDLVKRLLQAEPSKRLSLESCLAHEWLCSHGRPPGA
jgi:serine/threonine protein kinase